MKHTVKKKMIKIVFSVFYFVAGLNLFSSKINDYVNKQDIKKGNKIFIYKKNTEDRKNTDLPKDRQENTVKNEKSIDKISEESIKNAENKKTDEKKEKTEEIEMEYRNAKEISERLNGFKNLKLVGIDNKIIISGEDREINQIKKIIKSLDRPKDQIIIKGTIIDTSSNLFEKLGVDWSINSENSLPAKSNLIAKFLNGEVSIRSIFASGGKFLGIDFNLLKENGDIKIEAMPTLLIMEDEQGELKVTEEVLIGEKKTTKNNVEHTEPIFSEAGIVFRILPEIRKINGIKKILLKVDTEISNFKLTSSYNTSEGAKQKNQTKTVITLNNGGSTFIGGLKQNVGKETVRKIPFLSSIPIIGPLFKYKRTNREMRDIYIEIEAIIQETDY
ncbi:MAG: general secretion pathway protein GspD [Leptotrichiaceae bacterium]|nr:general secretion pathway protein GspD [Leptotrichiaceae bacterium]